MGRSVEIERWNEAEKSITRLTENIRKLTHTLNNQTQVWTSILTKIQYDVAETREQIKDATRECRKK